MKPEPVTWVWEPFLPEGGLVLLTAYMKTGKSTLAYALAVAVAQGKPFLGHPTKAGGVLILAVEEHQRDVVNRLHRFGMRPDDPLYVHAAPLGPASLPEVKRFIAQHQIRLVLLDTLSRYWNISDENDNAQVVRLGGPLLNLARETGAVVVLIHHERKSGGEDGRGIRGASALLGLVDQAVTMSKPPGATHTHHRVLSCLGRYDETPREVVIELDGDEYRAVGTSAGELGDDTKREAVWAALTADGKTVAQLMTETGLSRKTVDAALASMAPRVHKEGSGHRSDPFRYRRADSFLFVSNPIGGEETNVA